MTVKVAGENPRRSAVSKTPKKRPVSVFLANKVFRNLFKGSNVILLWLLLDNNPCQGCSKGSVGQVTANSEIFLITHSKSNTITLCITPYKQ